MKISTLVSSSLMNVKICDIVDGDASSRIGSAVKVCGWVQTKRTSGQQLAFLELNDGSTNMNLQVQWMNLHVP